MEQSSTDFLGAPEVTPEAQRLFDDDLSGTGYVTNVSRLWAHLPTALDRLADLMGHVTSVGSLTLRQRGVLVTATASTIDDSYCSLAWGKKLAEAAGPEVAAAVIRGDDDGLDPTERTLAAWARRVAAEPNDIAPDDVQALRDVGFDDEQILAITTYVALRLAFSTINDALGARPDSELGAEAPEPVRAAVTFGRPTGERRPT